MSVSVGVIGAGFYGLELARHLAKLGAKVFVYERESQPGAKASWANQSRVHAGYHYPRSFRTASRSRQNYSKFKADYSTAVVANFQAVYAIARRHSKTSSSQFVGFCQRAGLPLAVAPPSISKLFDPSQVESAFLTQEAAFDGGKLIAEAAARADTAGVEFKFDSHVTRVTVTKGGEFSICAAGLGDQIHEIVIDATYSSLGTLFAPAHSLASRIKIERAEISLFEPPGELQRLGLTVMDGPFFSFMPFPAKGLHSLTHVAYTPKPAVQPGTRLTKRDSTNRERMLRDAARFVPAISEAKYRESIFVDKAVLVSSEVDDSRPILFHQSGPNGRYISVLGSKIDNVYEAIESLKNIGAVKGLLSA